MGKGQPPLLAAGATTGNDDLHALVLASDPGEQSIGGKHDTLHSLDAELQGERMRWER